jgi:hypothetical protein
MNDDHFVIANRMIDKIGIAGDRKHANARDVGLAPKPRVSREQAARQTNLTHHGWRSACVVLGDVFVNIGDVGVGTRRTAASQTTLRPKRRHFAFSHELAALGLFEAFENGGAMILRYGEYIAARRGNLFQYLGGIDLPLFRQLPHLLYGVFQDLRQWRII